MPQRSCSAVGPSVPGVGSHIDLAHTFISSLRNHTHHDDAGSISFVKSSDAFSHHIDDPSLLMRSKRTKEFFFRELVSFDLGGLAGEGKLDLSRIRRAIKQWRTNGEEWLTECLTVRDTSRGPNNASIPPVIPPFRQREPRSPEPIPQTVHNDLTQEIDFGEHGMPLIDDPCDGETLNFLDDPCDMDNP